MSTVVESYIFAAMANVLLKVPYFSQLDNRSGTGYRECFSSSCAMLAAFWGRVRSDDEYNLIRASFGDTTDYQAQLATLRHLKLNAHFRTDGTPDLLESLLEHGNPVAVGWLHQGPVAAPSGGGHWSVVVGFTGTHWIHHDPNGEALLVRGGYTPNTNGAGMLYSRANWKQRWMPDGGGWLLTARPR
jgi:hypothetical protein